MAKVDKTEKLAASKVIEDQNKNIANWKSASTFTDEQLEELIVPRLRNSLLEDLQAGKYSFEGNPEDVVKGIKL